MELQRLLLIGAALVQFTLWLALAGRYRLPPEKPGVIVMRYGWKLRLLGLVIAFAIPLLLVLLMIVTPRVQTGLLVPLGVTLLTLGFVGGTLLVETQGVHLLLTDQTITGVSPWRRRREWPWTSLRRVSYSAVNQWLVLQGPDGKCIRASLALTNLGELARTVRRRVGATTYAPAQKIIERLERR